MGVTNERRFVRVNLVSPDVEIAPFNHTFSTLDRSIKERVFMVKASDGGFERPPVPKTPTHFEESLRSTLSLLSKHLPSTAPVSHDNFVATYKGCKRMDYEKALETLRLGRRVEPKDAWVKNFVKFEKTDWTSKKDPVPRNISPRDKRYNISLGRYLKPLEKRIFKSIGKVFGHPTVIKGYNAVDSARLLREKWEMFNDPVAVGLDASRFDQHVSMQALKWEHEVYLKCFPEKKHKYRLKKLLDMQLKNVCHAYAPDGHISFKVDGTRMSGDINTSMGNCVLMCSMIKAYSLSCGVDVQLANNGDDCVVFMERKDFSRFDENLGTYFTELGFNMVVEPMANEFEEIEFCQTRPIWDGQCWIMVRNPHTAIAKDSVMLCPWQGPKFFKGWLDSVGTGGLAMAGGIPVFQSLYRCYVKSGKKRKIPEELLSWSVRQAAAGMNRVFKKEISPECRASFYYAFGITPDEQLALERYYDSLVISPVLGSQFEPRLVFP